MRVVRFRKIGCICLLMGIAMLLGGCAEGTFHVKVHEDASADFDYKLGFDRSLLGVFAFSAEDIVARLRENAQIEGYEVSLYTDGAYTGVRLQRHVSSIYEENIDLGIFDFGAAVNADAVAEHEIGGPTFLLQDKIWHTEYRMHGSVDLSSIKLSDDYALPLFENSLLNRINVRLILTLPIIPEQHNATYVADDGHTLEWVLVLGKNNVIEMEGTVPNVKNRIYFLLVAIFSCLIGYLYYRHTRLHISS